jgi:hypothetical protein
VRGFKEALLPRRRLCNRGVVRLRIKLVWLLASIACVAVVAGVALMWRWKGQAIGISVGLPVAATLLTPIMSWIFTIQRRVGRSTAEQLQLAAQVLIDRSLEQWLTTAITQPALSGGPDTLDVPWMKSESGDDAEVTHWVTRTL